MMKFLKNRIIIILIIIHVSVFQYRTVDSSLTLPQEGDSQDCHEPRPKLAVGVGGENVPVPLFRTRNTFGV